jgi:hypothetical protein
MIPHSARSHAQVARVRMVSVGELYFGRETLLFCSRGRAGVGGADLFSLYFIAWHVSHH